MPSMIVIFGILMLSFAVPYKAQRCGTIVEPDTKIVGGEDSGGTRYPWFAVLRANIPGNQAVCGGTLITSKHVLTAAHCFGILEDMENKDKFIVDLNSYDRCNQDEEGRERHSVKDAYVHEKYVNVDSYYDIALIYLNETTSLPPACVPPPDNGSKFTVRGLIIGFGYLMEGVTKQPCHLRQASVQKYSQEKCLMTNVPDSVCENNTTFTGGADGIDTCQGDSGGPFLTYTNDDRLIVAGIVSFGYGCARKDLPGVYTNVASYIDWIEEHTGGMEVPDDAGDDTRRGIRNSFNPFHFNPEAIPAAQPKFPTFRTTSFPSDGRVIFPDN